MYIHERDNWTVFHWNASELTVLLEEVNRKQGLLYGRLASLGFDSKLKAMAENLTYDVVYSSEIEGIRLNVDEVRSSIARKLGIENIKQTVPSHYVDSVVAVFFCLREQFKQTTKKKKKFVSGKKIFTNPFKAGAQHEEWRDIIKTEENIFVGVWWGENNVI